MTADLLPSPNQTSLIDLPPRPAVIAVPDGQETEGRGDPGVCFSSQYYNCKHVCKQPDKSEVGTKEHKIRHVPYHGLGAGELFNYVLYIFVFI